MSSKEVDVEAVAGSGSPPQPPSSSCDKDNDNAAHAPDSSDSGSSHDAISPAISNNNDDVTDEVKEKPPSIHRVVTELGPPVKVPRSERRGLFARFALVAEVVDARTYPRRTKWYITGVVAAGAVVSPLGSSIFFPSLQQVAIDLNTTATITNLSIALYMLSLSIFPMWWSSFSEVYGRRSIYLISFAFFMVFNVLAAVSSSIGMLTVFRLLSGGASASVQAVGAGTLADVWEPRERGRAMGIFYLGPLCGPLFAPIIGGALANKWGWRSTLWFMVVYGVLTSIFIFFALPETLASLKNPATEVAEESPLERSISRVSSRRVARHTTRMLKVLKSVIVDPLHIILYLRFPAILLTVYYSSISFGALYMLNVSVQESFSAPPYRFSTLYVGLLYIPSALGYFLASVFGGRWMDNIMAREARKANRYDEKGRLVYRPEDRMRENAWLGALLYPAALIWYGWTVDKGVYWLVPVRLRLLSLFFVPMIHWQFTLPADIVPQMVANFFFGIGSMLIFGMVTTMLTEFMPKKSSTGVALNNFIRNIFSCVGVVVTSPIIQGIGNGWLFTILGVICSISSLAILAMKVYGPRWRKSMDLQMK